MSTYSLSSYADMLGDPTRMPAYLEALRRVVRPGSVVLDLGAGFGYFALVACRLGAARVYAIEPADSINALPELARLNGFGDRVTVFRELSTQVTLPERVDVIVADIRGTLPMLSGSLATMIDARDRLLAAGGTLLPTGDRLMVAPISDQALWNEVSKPWLDLTRPFEEVGALRFDPIHQRLAHSWRSRELSRRALLAPAQAWAEIDYRTNTSRDAAGEVEFTVGASATVHGLGMWFEAEILPGIRYSTGPDNRPTVYSTGFCPLLEPLAVKAGDRLQVALQNNDLGGEYHLRWRTKLVREGVTVTSFDQGDFFASSLDLEHLKRRLPGHVPALTPKGKLTRLVLEGAEAGLTIGQIANSLLEAAPTRFQTLKQAIDHAAQLIDNLNG